MIFLIWGIALLALVLFFISSIKKGQSILSLNRHLSSLSEDDLYTKFNLKADSLDDISVTLVSESVDIESTEEDEILIELYGSWTKDDEPTITHKNNLLIIEQDKNSLYNKLIKIKIPRKCITTNTNITATLKSGIIKISNFELNKLEIQNYSGLIEAKNISCNKSFVKNSSGIVRVENCNIADLSAENTSGSIYADGTFEQIYANATSGGINVSTTKDFTKDCNFNVISGSITLQLPENINADLNCKSISGNVFVSHNNTNGKSINQVFGNGSYKLNANCTSGTISINKN